MIITTTNQIEGKSIVEYKGIVFGEVIAGVNMFKDIAAGFRNMFGGRAASYEGELLQARTEAIEEMQQRALSIGANAIVGVKVDYETLGAENGMLMVTVSGTAVIVR
ncbi:putative heavy metal-binding protein [Carnobacteriaceae bacterium zg-ZUI252]|nr:putative heavy metal-binding protein [Carnobacteriaceae bacterium zg-ZUI252]MBS4770591.1 putative heavy metal-binding protein [Carnobacteriaceae bacterium zg-ZUI240]QTU83509.1 putative heavy metal-binding protein [Carnobacteriaceae bacterium zg-C25]